MTQPAAFGTDNRYRWQGLAHLLRVEAGEPRPLLLLWVHSFFSGVTVAPLFAAGNAMFLAQVGKDWLPHAYIASAAMAMGAAWIYNRARQRLTTTRLFRRLLLTLLAGVLLLRLGFDLTDTA